MRIRTLLVAGGLATAMVAGTAGVAAAASGPDTLIGNGNGSVQAYGNTRTGGIQSPQIGLIQGSLNKPCLALAGTLNVGSLIGVIPVTAQDLNILSSPQNQQCAENSSQSKGDEPLSHILSDDPILSGNGSGRGRAGRADRAHSAHRAQTAARRHH